MPEKKVYELGSSYSNEDARLDIAAIVIADDGRLYLSEHAKSRMLERNISISQIRQVLTCNHSIVTNDVHLTEKGEWKCTIEGVACGQKVRLPVVLTKPLHSGVLVITAIGI